MKCLAFAKRNFKEIVRDPLSFIFCIGFPIILLLLFKVLTSNFSREEMEIAVPQFLIENLVAAISVFSFSFITLFAGMLVAKDRSSSFLARLRTSPMTSKDFILGYMLPLLPIAIIQIVLCYSMAFILGLKFTGYVLLSIVALIPSAILFIALGLLLGSLVSDKSVGGISSIIINVSAILGGMFFPLDTMNKTIKIIAYIFPFANCVKLPKAIIAGDFTNLIYTLIIILAYTIGMVVLSIIVFKRKINSDKC